MAANCVVIRSGIPVPVNRESFNSLEEGIFLNVQSGSGYPGSGGCYQGKGKLYLTNFRLIFLKENPTPLFSSFSIPYKLITKYKFKKGILGGSSICGNVNPVRNGGLYGPAKFEIKFDDNSLTKIFFDSSNTQIENSQSNPSEGHRIVCNTPSLVITQIFPDQFANANPNRGMQGQSLANRSAPILPNYNNNINNINNNDNNNNNNMNNDFPPQLMSRNHIGNQTTPIIVSQSQNYQSLTSDFRPNPARIFPQTQQSSQMSMPMPMPMSMSVNSGMNLVGASMSPFSNQSKNEQTILPDAMIVNNNNNNNNFNYNYAQPMINRPLNPSNNMHNNPYNAANQSQNIKKYSSVGLNEAYVDPDNPDEIFVTFDDNQTSNQKISNDNNPKQSVYRGNAVSVEVGDDSDSEVNQQRRDNIESIAPPAAYSPNLTQTNNQETNPSQTRTTHTNNNTNNKHKQPTQTTHTNNKKKTKN